MSKSVIIIPSRLSAIRLPNKPLIKINNKSLIMHVYEKAIKSKIGEVYVATCDKEIALEVKKNGGKFIMTNVSHTNGTDRVYEASKKLDLNDFDFIINVQGDEPMINPSDIIKLKEFSIKNKLDFSTLAYKLKSKKIYNNKNVVKVIKKKKITKSSFSEAQTFKRKVILNSYQHIYHHLGIYLYKFSTLKKFVNLNKNREEITEKLEQLRAINNGININVLLANHFSSGIDTEKDLIEYIKLLNKKKK